ncbi:acyl-CoA dehydrogenase family protein, partial [Acidiphilium sp.]|uniref:acyl-CoA dehydrogenase family protein n=1 Tax=Acidiphilium sp. TaxID=527 RepID=UPI00258370EC
MTGSPYDTPAHDAYRDTLRHWVAREVEPYAEAWDEAGSFPRDLYPKAAEIGLIPLGYPEEYGGIPGDLFYLIIGAQELARAGAGGIMASLLSHTIGAPPIVRGGGQALKQRVLPGIMSGGKISALAITEPGCGSDVAALRTAARRDGG